jgi:hypothetical protein
MIGRVSSSFKSERRAINFTFTIKWQPLMINNWGVGPKKTVLTD